MHLKVASSAFSRWLKAPERTKKRPPMPTAQLDLHYATSGSFEQNYASPRRFVHSALCTRGSFGASNVRGTNKCARGDTR
eukprot:12352483-Alexandrium_andersonii.AAC.1